MRFLQTYRQFLAAFLVSLFAFVFAAQVAHTLVHHHEEHEELCDVTCDESKAHFHAQKHENEHCSLCDFTFSAAELPVFQAFILKNELSLFHFIIPFYQVYFSTEINQLSTRGPPNV